MHIIGTAGHVDHGKSALVIALTGHNPDRWLEERERGMTLDLGFAPLHLDGGVEAGIIDVPGHERFLHNMLAGAAGMELLLLVVAANEGPKPQTHEHLQILNFLNVRRAIIVVTKSDLVNDDELATVTELAREAAVGTVAQGAPVVPVSSTSGAGIGALKSVIRNALADLPARRGDAPAFMPVDRVFNLPGRGTIVTGTLMQGTIRVGDKLELQPSGIETRARSVQVFGKNVEEATGGSRVAVNLPGVETADIGRGETLVAPHAFAATADLPIEFTAISAALGMLRRRTHVRAHIGAAEIPGVLVFDDRTPAGVSAVRARLALARPVVAYPGSRLIVRRMSPKDLLGGAIAVSPLIGPVFQAPAGFEQDVPESTGFEAPILAIVERAGIAPLPVETIATAANLKIDAARLVVDDLLQAGLIIEIEKPVGYITRTRFDAAFEVITAVLRERHRSTPWKLGCTVGEIAAELGVREAQATRLLDALGADGRLAVRGRFWHLPDFSPTFTDDQRALFAASLREDPRNPLVPQAFADVASRVAKSKVPGAVDTLETLLGMGTLVRIGDDVYRRAQIERARKILTDLLRGSGGATMAQVRDALGTSRKYALPLMEYFDAMGLTLRDGDLRRLRSAIR